MFPPVSHAIPIGIRHRGVGVMNIHFGPVDQAVIITVRIKVTGSVGILLLGLGQSIIIKILGAIVINGNRKGLGHTEAGNIGGTDEDGKSIICLEIISGIRPELIAHQGKHAIILSSGPRD